MSAPSDTAVTKGYVESKSMVVRRKMVKPQTKKDKLPITNYEHDFIKRLEKEKILVVEASTGSGKSTQLPQYVAKSDLFQAERRKATGEFKYGGTKSPLGTVSQGKMVVSTQPNAFAAAAVATRVGFEYDDDVLGRKVGLITPTEHRFDPTQCEILFVSDSELVRIMTQDKLLSRVGVLIIDEAHERTLYTDVIMTLAKEIREQREDFYIVISSATIEVKRFLSFMFNLDDSFAAGTGNAMFQRQKHHAPLTVQGKTYEVSVTYDPLEVRDPSQEKDPYLSQILTPKLAQVFRKYLNPTVKGHGLVFVEDTHTVLRVVHHLRRFLRVQSKICAEQGVDPKTTTKFLTAENTRVIPLYLSMPLKEQQKIMDFVRSFTGSKDIRYVFVADNVAETSITLPDVKLVIDTGRMMVSTFDMMRRLMVTEETFVSRDRASQRQGRTGRTSPGMCVRLYNETDLKFDRVEPDIKRVALDKVALQLAAMNINPKALRLIEPPEDHKFVFAIEQLIQYQCLISNAQNDFASHLEITDKGRVFVQLPFAPDVCEQLWQASLISAEATTIMHCISCLFNNESSNIFEHSPGLTWKALAEQVIDERKFDISPHIGINNNMLASQHWTPAQRAQLLLQEQQQQLKKMGQNASGKQNFTELSTVAVFNPLIDNPNPLIIDHNFEMTDIAGAGQYGVSSTVPRNKQQPHIWYNPFWQTNPALRFGFNLNNGSDLELGYFMYHMLMHYKKPGCSSCARRNQAASAPVLDHLLEENPPSAANDQESLFSITARRNKQTDLDDLGLDADDGDDANGVENSQVTNNSTDFKRCELCNECENDFRQLYHILPTAIKQAENFIRSTRDLVHKSLSRNYSQLDAPVDSKDKSNVNLVNNLAPIVATKEYRPHPTNFTPSRIMTHCIYTALSHMAGVVLVTDHLSEGVVLPHKYFKMVKASIDPNTTSQTVDTYYKLVTIPAARRKKTLYSCIKYFVVIHVTARQSHDYNITCLHPFDISDLTPTAQESFRNNIAQLQLQRVATYARIGRALYSSIDFVLSNQRIENMARQYELEKSHLRQQQLRMQGNMNYRPDDSESTRNMEAMNWSRFAAIPISQGILSLHTLSRYQDETIRKMEEIIVTASRHIQHLYERERRAYRLPLSTAMWADIQLTYDFSIKELIIHADGKSFAVRPADVQRSIYSQSSSSANTALPLGERQGGFQLGGTNRRDQSLLLQQQKFLANAKHQGSDGVDIQEVEDSELTKEFGTNANVAAVATDVADLEQLWRQQQNFNPDDYAAALGDDEDDDIEMLDDGLLLPGDLRTNSSHAGQVIGGGPSTTLGIPTLAKQPSLVSQRSVERLPHGQGVSLTYSQSTDRQRNEVRLSQIYDPLQITRFPSSIWAKHDARKEYKNTLSLRKRLKVNTPILMGRLATVHDVLHNVRNPTDVEEDLLRSVSPVRELYSSIHHCFESILKSLKVLHQYQYFPLIPDFPQYDSIVSNVYDQCTASFRLKTPQTALSMELQQLLTQFGEFDPATNEFFVASLLDVQSCINSVLVLIDKHARSVNLTHPKDYAQAVITELGFEADIFVQLHFDLGPRDLISWIQLAPSMPKLFSLEVADIRRFIAPGNRPIFLEGGKIGEGKELIGGGALIDRSDLRLLQVSEDEISQFCSVTLNIDTFDLLYTISVSVDHSEIFDMDDALLQIQTTLQSQLGKKHYHVEVLERIDIIVSEQNSYLKKPHTRTQITFSGNQTSVIRSAQTLVQICEPASIPVGPLTNSTNALLQLMCLSGSFSDLVTSFGLAGEYVRHGSDGSLSLWGTAKGVNSLHTQLGQLVAEFERRRRAFPLPHNIFADLKNENENSPYFSAYQLLLEQIDKVTNSTAKYQLRTDETAFIVETLTPQDLTACLQPIRGFKSKCSIDDDDRILRCFVCQQFTPESTGGIGSSGVTVQKLSTCDHPICGSCLHAHVQYIIQDQRRRILEAETEKQLRQDQLGDAAVEIAKVVSTNPNAKHNKNAADEYSRHQHTDQVKLLSELKQTFPLQCPCYQTRFHGGGEYLVKLASTIGIERPLPGQAELTYGKGCEFSLLPSDIARICTPSQIHDLLFLLAKPAMKATNAYLPCPSASCNTVLPLNSYYQHCPRCNTGLCTQCNVSNSSLHQLLPCHIFKGILSYHDQVHLLFSNDCRILLEYVAKSGKLDSSVLANAGSNSGSILAPYVGQELQARVQICALILEQCRRWLASDWTKQSFQNRELVPQAPELFVNPGLFAQCGSYIRFIRGCRQKLKTIPAYHSIFSRGGNNPIEYDTKTHLAIFHELFQRGTAKFAYHGTPQPKNCELICHHGLDPAFRSGQAYGPGEYLGVSPSVSFDYGREFFVLVMFLDQEDAYTTQPGFCYVIRNPIDFQSAYCLPIGVVRVSDTATHVNMPFYPLPKLGNSGEFDFQASCASWLTHMGIDERASWSSGFYKTGKLDRVTGVTLPNEVQELNLKLHKPNTPFLADQRLYALPSTVKVHKVTRDTKKK